MPRVVSHVEVEAVSDGGTLRVAPDTIVTPLARERAEHKRVQIVQNDREPTSPAFVRQVTREVVARLPGGSPETIEAVVAEILAAAGSSDPPRASTHAEQTDFDVCASCVENERSRHRSRAVLNVTGRNARGICATVTAALADVGADILDISQTLVADFFSMIVVFDTRELSCPFDEASRMLEERIGKIGMKATVMHEDVLSSLHRV